MADIKKMIDLDTLWSILNYHNVEKSIDAQNAIKANAVEATEVRRGHWIKKCRCRGRYKYDDLYCSECNGQAPDNWLDYCARCGAIMFEDENVEKKQS